LRHRLNACDNPRSKPEDWTVSTNDTAPAYDTTLLAAVSIWTRGYNPIFFTLMVLLVGRRSCLRTSIIVGLEHFLVDQRAALMKAPG